MSKYVLAFAVISVVSLGALLFVRGEGLSASAYAEADTIAADTRSFDELATRFEVLADEKGALYAYEILRRADLPPQTDLHLLGHVVGDKLYEQKKIEGIQNCTQDFRNACSHSIVIGTLSEFGEAGLDDIREACKQAPGGGGAYTMCFHGLGHGVFSHFAFQFPETIEFCRKTGTEEHRNREYIECVGGAVMELMGGGGHDPLNWEKARNQYVDGKDTLDLCLGNTMPDDVKEICLTYLTPHIWERVGINLGSPDPNKFKDAFATCDTIPASKQHLRNACFGSFGKDFIPLIASRDIRAISDMTNVQFAVAARWCSFAEDRDGRHACIQEAVASTFWGGENDPDAAFRFCSLITDGDMQQACHERLAQDIRSFVREDARRTSLCSRIPEDMQHICTIEL